MNSFTLAMFCVLALIPNAAKADTQSAPFVTVDQGTGLFLHGDRVFTLSCVTYVQPDPMEPGTNSGENKVLSMDPRKFRSDFRHMRRLGIEGIYMRIGAGMFLNPDGSWRRYDDEFIGVFNPEAAHQHALDMRDKLAEEEGIDPFTYTYEMFDYLLDCAEAEGIYVLPMFMDNWSLPRKYDNEEKKMSILFEDDWEQTIRDWSKILERYSDRRIILGYLVEGETLDLRPWNFEAWRYMTPDGPQMEQFGSPIEAQDPELTRKFQDFLRKRHGTIEALRSRWSHGYDRENPHYNERGVPLYDFVAGYFDDLESFDDIELPVVERAKDEPKLERGPHFPYWTNVPFDPVWADFGYFKSWLYVIRLNELFNRLREVVPNQMFIISAAWDAVPIWHPFFVTWDFGAFDCEVILHGGGYTQGHITGQIKESVTFGLHEMVLEIYQSVAPYRPFARRYPVQAFGMGEGGLSIESNNPAARTTTIPYEKVDRWVTGLLMDNFGSGAALTNIWDWGVLTGATPERLELHDHPVTESMQHIAEVLERDTFLSQREPRTLILANGPALHSLMQPLEYDNLVALSSILTAAHHPFDIATTDNVSLGPEPANVDLNEYDAIFIPQQFQTPVGTPGRDVWDLLANWLELAPDRLLCVGLTTLRDAYFNPIDELPSGMKHVFGDVVPGPLMPADGEMTWDIVDSDRDLPLDFVNGRVQSIESHSAETEPFLTDGDHIMGVRRIHENGGRAYYLGMPLGLSWMYVLDPELGGGRLNERFDLDVMAVFYGEMLEDAGIDADYEADPMVQAYISDNATIVFIRNRDPEAWPSEASLTSPRLAIRFYAGAVSDIQYGNDSKNATVTTKLGRNAATIIESLGTINMLGEGALAVDATDSVITDDGTEYQITVSGDAPGQFLIGDDPNPIYEHEAGTMGTFIVLHKPSGTTTLVSE